MRSGSTVPSGSQASDAADLDAVGQPAGDQRRAGQPDHPVPRPCAASARTSVSSATAHRARSRRSAPTGRRCEAGSACWLRRSRLPPDATQSRAWQDSSVSRGAPPQAVGVARRDEDAASTVRANRGWWDHDADRLPRRARRVPRRRPTSSGARSACARRMRTCSATSAGRPGPRGRLRRGDVFALAGRPRAHSPVAFDVSAGMLRHARAGNEASGIDVAARPGRRPVPAVRQRRRSTSRSPRSARCPSSPTRSG